MRLSWLPRLAGTLFFLSLPLYAVKLYRKSDGTDFDVYYKAGARALAGEWDLLYTLQDAFTPFRYAPWTIGAFAPFAWLPLPWARVAWLLLGQALPTALAFLLLRKLGRALAPERAEIAASLSFLLVFRFILDQYLWGQVSGLLLWGLALTLAGFLWSSPARAGIGVTLGAILKIAPAMGAFYAFFRERALLARALLASLASLAGLTLLHVLWIPPARFLGLFADWAEIVRMDRAYAYPAKYGSQSFLSFFARLARDGHVPQNVADLLGRGTAAAFVLFVLWFWARRKPKDAIGTAHSFGLAAYAFLFAMTQTYRYTYVLLALPLWALLLSPLSRLGKIALLVMIPTLSLAGKDIIGGTVYFGMQEISVPLFATLLLFAASLEAARKHTA